MIEIGTIRFKQDWCLHFERDVVPVAEVALPDLLLEGVA